MAVFVGIDLGTTYSVVAYVNQENIPQTIPNLNGGYITPSVVFLGPGGPIVGDEAKEKMASGECDTVAFFKRLMGDPHYVFTHGERQYSPVDLSALVLSYLKESAEKFLHEKVTYAVVTVPAYFNNLQRTATMRAAEKAGLQILSIINEPTAAALAYGLRPVSGSQTLMIYDLGGGTFDVSIVQITSDEQHVLSTDGDFHLGGKDWDDRIFSFLEAEFEKEFGFSPVDDDYHALLSKAEEVKKSLSVRNSIDVRVSSRGKSGQYRISQEQFANLTHDLLERTQQLCENALTGAGLSWAKIDHVLLVGGSTRMPMVSRWIEMKTGQKPLKTINPDEAVALGAALQAAADMVAMVSKDEPVALLGRKKTFDVISHSLGLVAVSEDSAKYVNKVLIPKNRPVPASETQPYQLFRAPWEKNKHLEVYLTQGESDDPSDCAFLGKYVFSGFSETSVGKITLDITYTFDRNGVVHVSAIDQQTKLPLHLSLEPLPDDVPYRFGLPPSSSDSGIPQPYNTHSGQQEIIGVLKDRFGNAKGNEYDLARDGSFRGAKIAVLHLYTGEGFDFHLPGEALEQKGFTIKRWVSQPPIQEFEDTLAHSCQLWLISSNGVLLSHDHQRAIKRFFEEGKGLYIWGDNEPYFADANLLLQLLFRTEMSGNLPGDQTVPICPEGGKVGLARHLVTTGIERLYEGITIASIRSAGDLKPLIYGSSGNIVAMVYEKDGKRAIVDGGFTRLFHKWDTAGTARYVKNAASWLANYERWGAGLLTSG